MKILHINCVYRKGSTGKLLYDIHSELKKRGVSSTVCYGRGDTVHEPDVYKTCSELSAKFSHLTAKLTGLPYGGCLLSTSRLLRRIKKEQPSVVHIHCINGYFVNIYRLIVWLKKHRYPTVLTLHAEFQFTANCAHAMECMQWKTGCTGCADVRNATGSVLLDRTAYSWKRMKQSFEGFPKLTVVSVSPWLQNRAQMAPILSDFRHLTVLNGIDCEVFRYYEDRDLRSAVSSGYSKICFHVTASFSHDKNHPKGGWYLLELARRCPDVLFLVASNEVEKGELPANVRILGTITDQTYLAKLYSVSDITVLTGKRETFSMPVAESLCCGTPVVGFCAGGPESIAIPNVSCFVPFSDMDALEAALRNALSKPFDKSEISAAACKLYDKRVMAEKYFTIYQQSIE